MAVNTTYTNPASSPPDLVTGQTLTQQAYEMILSNINATGGSDGTGGVLGGVAPPGSVLAYGAGTTDPTGWFLCDGRAVSRTTYARLFAILSTTFGVGDGSSTFNLPDLRGRAIFGADNMGTSAGAASRFTSSNTLGATAQGEFTHALSVAELATHTHGVTDPLHGHVQQGYTGGGSASAGKTSVNTDPGTSPSGPGPGFGGASQVATQSSATGIVLVNAGSGTAHNTIPLSQILNWIVKN